MARNEEKAQLMLNRWVHMKEEEFRGKRERRPFLATECDNLSDAERWRRTVLKEVTKKIAEIQNENIPEHKTRDLNDEINKLMREKGHWERRIVELSGPDYSKIGAKITDDSGTQVPGGRGSYRYYGAAKKLPGVAELFRQEPPPPPKRTRFEMYKGVDADYYGYRDDDDGTLKPLERLEEEQAKLEALEQWKIREIEKCMAEGKDMGKARSMVEAVIAEFEKPQDAGFISHVSVPKKEDLEKAVLDKRKKRLMEKYVTKHIEAQEKVAVK